VLVLYSSKAFVHNKRIGSILTHQPQIYKQYYHKSAAAECFGLEPPAKIPLTVEPPAKLPLADPLEPPAKLPLADPLDD
jgi:hypothetical protein